MRLFYEVESGILHSLSISHDGCLYRFSLWSVAIPLVQHRSVPSTFYNKAVSSSCVSETQTVLNTAYNTRSRVVEIECRPNDLQQKNHLFDSVWNFGSVELTAYWRLPSLLWHCWLGDSEGHLACKTSVLVCWWWWFDWSFARYRVLVVFSATSFRLIFHSGTGLYSGCSAN